ncbi:extracellular solute-binding protein [Telmatocola sphagniphila]|uniref:Extracellular solute-binding protein n=1 Tax=Telmatocola sphagniphila TaxID=1123043 RepID=A0A8E6EUS1_9BACT|nr:extracellular solute-binding protein [Telmatocola sphagniphila]QVL31765.1 extracellular solute-binding protein [Telmatocola sphagniphila]
MKLTLFVSPDYPHSDLIEQRIKSWSLKSGASIRLSSDVNLPADLYFYPAFDLPRLVEAGKLAKVTPEFRGVGSTYDWNDLMSPYSQRLALWNGQPFGIPLLGEGEVLVWRSDKFKDPKKLQAFREKFKTEPRAPETWDELTNWAEFWNTPEAPTLTAFPTRAEDIQRIFLIIASCYERKTLINSDVGQKILSTQANDELFSFLYDLKTYAPRLASPAFQYAAELLARMQKCRPSGTGDPVEAIKSGSALFAILKLDELARLKPQEGLELAPLPGAAFTYDYNSGQKVIDKSGAINRMPFIGWGAWFGGVGADTKNPAAAFDFFADFGNPTKTSLELLAAAKWGVGPYRRSHEETRNQTRFLGYGFDKKQTEHLLTALRFENTSSIINYRLSPRTPDVREQTAILAEALQEIVSGKTQVDAGLQKASRLWIELGKKQPEAVRKQWIRNSLGI